MKRALGYFGSHLREQGVANVPNTGDGLRANQWMETSAEYKAAVIQTFNVALNIIEGELASFNTDREKCAAGITAEKNSGVCPAVIMDLDENGD